MLHFDRSTVKNMVLRIFKMIATSGFLHDSFRVHRIRFRAESAPDPAGGTYSVPPDLLAGLRKPTSKKEGRKRKGREREGKKGERKGRGR